MIDKKYILNCNKDEIRLILESLLYSSSVDVMGQFDIDYCKKFLTLAEKIRTLNTDVLLENLELLKMDNSKFEDDHSNQIVNLFPEIVIENIEV